MGTGLQLGLVLPSPALEGAGWPGLWGRQGPGIHISQQVWRVLQDVVGPRGRLPRVEAWQGLGSLSGAESADPLGCGHRKPWALAQVAHLPATHVPGSGRGSLEDLLF